MADIRRNMTPEEIQALWQQHTMGLQPTMGPVSLADLAMEPVGSFLDEADVSKYLLPAMLLGIVRSGPVAAKDAFSLSRQNANRVRAFHVTGLPEAAAIRKEGIRRDIGPLSKGAEQSEKAAYVSTRFTPEMQEWGRGGRDPSNPHSIPERPRYALVEMDIPRSEFDLNFRPDVVRDAWKTTTQDIPAEWITKIHSLENSGGTLADMVRSSYRRPGRHK